MVTLPVALPGQTATEYEAKAAFLFNFTKFVSWPDSTEANNRDFVIAAPASSPFGASLQSLDGRRVQGRTVKVLTYADARLPFPCDVLVLNLAVWRELSETHRDELRERHVLTVGEAEAFTHQGGVLSLFLIDDHLAFDINVEAARRAELVISANLLNLAYSHQRKGLQ